LATDQLTPVVPATNWDQKARIYALADPAVIFKASDFIERCVYAALQVAPSSRHRLDISESSGWLSYEADGELWNRIVPPALPTQAEAVKAAEGALSKLARSCSDANPDWPEPLRGISLLPPVNLLGRIGARAVARPDGSAWDHWIYRAEPRLQVDGGATTTVGVFGAQVEVRIGHLGQVVGIRSRWRPTSGERKLVDFVAFPTPAGDGTSGAGNTEQPPPIVNFLLEGDGIPQYYLAPYYFSTDGNDIRMSSASQWSLTVDIGRTAQDDSQMTLTALAQGGSGNYRYNWAVYSLTDLTTGYRELGSGRSDTVDSLDGRATTSSLQIENGHYIVMLNVKDLATGAFKHLQQQIFSSVFRSSQDAIVA
jgi:hypothetical protein